MCIVCDRINAPATAADNLATPLGAVAQLVERVHGMDEAVGSIPISSTQQVSHFALGGIIAGEGCFVITPLPSATDGSPRVRFVFQMEMASRDEPLLTALKSVLGFGSVHRREPRRAHWQPTSTYVVNSRVAHRTATIPFMHHYLLPCVKRSQFDLWRAAFESYEATRPTQWGQGPSPCNIAGCDRPVRGRGLCRSHYYEATGY
jgi:hypothetical protein